MFYVLTYKCFHTKHTVLTIGHPLDVIEDYWVIIFYKEISEDEFNQFKGKFPCLQK